MLHGRYLTALELLRLVSSSYEEKNAERRGERERERDNRLRKINRRKYRDYSTLSRDTTRCSGPMRKMQNYLLVVETLLSCPKMRVR